MTNEILVAFAMKEEFAPWRRRHRFHPIANSAGTAMAASFGSSNVHVSLVGAGAPDVDRFYELTTSTPCAHTVGIVTGVAAGLKPQWQTGHLLVAQSVCSSDGAGGIAACPSLVDLAVACGARRAPNLITVARVARTIEAKAHLAAFGDAADMESLPMVRQWASQGIPAVAVRVIVDPVDMPMTCDFEAALDAHGQLRVTKLLSQLTRQPQLLPDFLHLAIRSRRALKTLASFLDRFIAQLDRQFSGAA